MPFGSEIPLQVAIDNADFSQPYEPNKFGE